jgi:hypothetical protein
MAQAEHERRLDQRDQRVVQAWLTAYLGRCRRMPRLAQLLNRRPQPEARLTPEERRREWQELNRMFDGSKP